MKKLLVLAVSIALASFVVVSEVRAEGGSELEISGNLTSVTGWQHSRAGARQTPTMAGLLGDGLAAMGGTGTTTFGFFIDQIELDLAKSFGENIRMRADLDFTPAAGTGKVGILGGTGDILVEQAYTTVNIPAGNGIEFLVGRFNSGIGLDPIDRNELKTISHNMIHRVLLPHNITGARAAYDFSDQLRWEVYVVNSLGDVGIANSDMPSLGTNLSYSWGDQGSKSWIKFTGAGGPEQATKKHWSFLGDLTASVAATEALRIGVEGTMRQDDTPTAGTANAKYIGGQLKGRYAFSDVWDGTVRYGYVWDLNGGVGATQPIANHLLGATGLGAAGNLHTLSVATGYQITDGARLVVEGGLDLSRAHAGGTSAITSGLAGMFAYSF